MDWSKIEQLLHVVGQTADHGPKYAPIITAAQLELEEHLAEAKKVVEENTAKRVADAALEAKKKAEAQKELEAKNKTVETVDPKPYQEAKAVAAADFNKKVEEKPEDDNRAFDRRV